MLMVQLFAVMAVSYWLVPALTPIFTSARQKNYTGRLVPTGLGLAFVFSASGAWLLWPPLTQGQPSALPVAILLGFALFGLVDDILGSGQHRGFRGHLQAALGGKVTTGSLKALGGGLLALLVGLWGGGGLVNAVVTALLIVLTANLINLLDLRPGRAGKAFVILALATAAVSPRARWLLFLIAGVVGYLPWDLQAAVMMGDTGANPLGAALGFALAESLAGWPRLVGLGVLVVVNLAAERLSFSQLIASQPVLNRLDKLGRDEEE